MILTTLVNSVVSFLPALLGVLTIIDNTLQIASLLVSIYNSYQIKFDADQVISYALDDHEKMSLIETQISEISRDLTNLEADIVTKIDRIDTLIKRLPLQKYNSDVKRKINESFFYVSNMFNQFLGILNHTKSREQGYVDIDFIDSITTMERDGLNAVINELHSILVPGRSTIFLESFMELILLQTSVSTFSSKKKIDQYKYRIICRICKKSTVAKAIQSINFFTTCTATLLTLKEKHT